MNEADYSLLKIRLTETMTSSQNRRVDGSDLYAENGRIGYLMAKDRVSFHEATAQRFVQESGPQRERSPAPNLNPLPVTGNQPQQGQ